MTTHQYQLDGVQGLHINLSVTSSPSSTSPSITNSAMTSGTTPSSMSDTALPTSVESTTSSNPSPLILGPSVSSSSSTTSTPTLVTSQSQPLLSTSMYAHQSYLPLPTNHTNHTDLEGLSPHLTTSEVDLLAYHDHPDAGMQPQAEHLHSSTATNGIVRSTPGEVRPLLISTPNYSPSPSPTAAHDSLLITTQSATPPSQLLDNESSLAPLHHPPVQPLTLTSLLPVPVVTSSPTSGSLSTPTSASSVHARSTKSTVGRFEVLEQESSPASRTPPGTMNELEAANIVVPYPSPESCISGVDCVLSPISPASAISSATTATRQLSNLEPIDAIAAARLALSSIREESTSALTSSPFSGPNGIVTTSSSAIVSTGGVKSENGIGATLATIRSTKHRDQDSSSSEEETDSDDDGDSSANSSPKQSFLAPSSIPAPLQLPISPALSTNGHHLDASTRSTVPPSSSTASSVPTTATSRTTKSGRFSIVDFQDDSISMPNGTISSSLNSMTSHLMSHQAVPQRRRSPHLVLESISQFQHDYASLASENDMLMADTRTLISHIMLLRGKLEAALMGQLAVDTAQEVLKATEIGSMNCVRLLAARAQQQQQSLTVQSNSPLGTPMQHLSTMSAPPTGMHALPPQAQPRRPSLTGAPPSSTLSAPSATHQSAFPSPIPSSARSLHPSAAQQQMHSPHHAANQLNHNLTPSPAVVTKFFEQQQHADEVKENERVYEAANGHAHAAKQHHQQPAHPNGVAPNSTNAAASKQHHHIASDTIPSTSPPALTGTPSRQRSRSKPQPVQTNSQQSPNHSPPASRAVGKSPHAAGTSATRSRGRNISITNSPNRSPGGSPSASRTHSPTPRTPHSARKGSINSGTGSHHGHTNSTHQHHHHPPHHATPPTSTGKMKQPSGSPKVRPVNSSHSHQPSHGGGSTTTRHAHTASQSTAASHNGSQSAKSANSSNPSFASRLAASAANTSPDPLDLLASKCIENI